MTELEILLNLHDQIKQHPYRAKCVTNADKYASNYFKAFDKFFDRCAKYVKRQYNLQAKKAFDILHHDFKATIQRVVCDDSKQIYYTYLETVLSCIHYYLETGKIDSVYVRLKDEVKTLKWVASKENFIHFERDKEYYKKELKKINKNAVVYPIYLEIITEIYDNYEEWFKPYLCGEKQ